VWLLSKWTNYECIGFTKSNPNPTDEDIDNYMSGNICRCGTYLRIKEAIKAAAKTSTLNKKRNGKYTITQPSRFFKVFCIGRRWLMLSWLQMQKLLTKNTLNARAME
jgi:hypothetical protein